MISTSIDEYARASEAEFARALDRLVDDELRAFADDVLCGIRRSSWPSIAWRSSALTAGGCPVELAFSSTNGAARFTAEIAGPEVEHHRRLDMALALTPDAEPGIADRLRRLQAGSHLRWGAWFGGRVIDRRRNGKVYVEAPGAESPASRELVEDLLGVDLSARLGRPIPLRMVGWEPSGERLELYLRAGELDDVSLSRLLSIGGQGPRLDEVHDLVADLCRSTGRPVLPGASYGCSFSVPLDPARRHAGTGVSVFSFARAMLGHDRRVRDLILGLAERRGWDFSGYEAVSRAIAGARATRLPVHGMVSFVMVAGRAPAFHVGIRPPAAPA